ncbi:MAG: type II toxin-antitoxin system Phd/YefM family antitoxin [Myxococcaceae bacterium]
MNVSVRELRDHLSACLRKVERGQRLTVTDHGRPVAEILPLSERQLSPRERLERLVLEGELTAPRGKGFATVRPSRVRGEPLSSTLLEERR